MNDEIYEAYRNVEKAYASLGILLEDLFDCSYIREGLNDYMKLIPDQNGVMAEITCDYLSKAEQQLRELDGTANF